MGVVLSVVGECRLSVLLHSVLCGPKIKVKKSGPCLRHEGVWGLEGIAPLILNLSATRE